jgi:single-stranded DNA-binding protein
MYGTNRITLIGHAEGDPQLGVAPNGIPVLNLRVAVEERPRGSRAPRVEFFAVSLYSMQAPAIARMISDGTRVRVEGSGRHEKRTGRDGIERVYFKVQAVDVAVELVAEPEEAELESDMPNEAA